MPRASRLVIGEGGWVPRGPVGAPLRLGGCSLARAVPPRVAPFPLSASR
jgi:hypothetical protein